MRFPLLRNRTG